MSESIRDAVERASAQLAAHPEGPEADQPATAVIEEGLRVRVEGPKGTVVTDMAEAVGGGGGAPTPGWLLRAALASCDVSGIAIEAARRGVELTSLTVTVESDSDARGALGLDDSIPPGPLEVRRRIALTASNAGPDELRELVRRAEALSPVGDAFARSLSVTTEIVAG
jgi:uncharacterized OsmC-like protein